MYEEKIEKQDIPTNETLPLVEQGINDWFDEKKEFLEKKYGDAYKAYFLKSNQEMLDKVFNRDVFKLTEENGRFRITKVE